MNLFIATLAYFLFMPKLVKSQTQEDHIITVEEIYTRLISNEVSSFKYIFNPVSKNSLLNIDKETSILNSTIISDVITDFKSDWEFIIFNDALITKIEKDNILVRGYLSGKNYEQGIIKHQEFQHTWLIQNEIIIKFLD
ncbi:hypothetical protein [Xanthomarina sp. F2636L]|uniref:hypothetical protein n=1 Tax=Xanthomarina sp. F2636L TaxID=2996018 RepID=UPI00225E0327|nr:hypothetical protein [Xanthomarina sp. F2636L]MCX7550501.1 hypothetical protein [Xanthomarina sp. F2636L]